MKKAIHIISFDIPYPPTYGGIIDVYYKIKALFDLGFEIHLHLFQYGRSENKKLNQYCNKVYYYQRNTSFFKALSTLPYIVSSRANHNLVKNLIETEAPILFEGLHCTFPLKRKELQSRLTLVRTHNIEHRYYANLARTEPNLIKKLHYNIEAIKLKWYEKVLNKCDHILTISTTEGKYFADKYKTPVFHVPAFHPNKKVADLSKKGYFALFHGNLKVSDNLKAAKFLIDTFKNFDYPLVIAGQTDDKTLMTLIDRYKNINYIEIKKFHDLLELFQRAHVNILYSYQPTGVKIKLLNSLYNSRYVISNKEAAAGSGLESLCQIANSKKEIQQKVSQLILLDYSNEEISKRKKVLTQYNCLKNAEKIADLLGD